MSHATIASVDLVAPRSTRVTGTATNRPLLVVETLDHSAGSTVQFTYTYAMDPGPDGGTPLFTFCAQAAPADTPQFTFCAQAAATDNPLFTFCAQAASADASGAWTAAPAAVEGNAVAGAWI
ncbi:hypothetical protein FB563_8276 [Streptomyces puniciscabiei]|uniref:Uncharacterized protein n=1 Tax=Streptomyces puniciscabiei TaxID=164348 RepID=A0A542SXF2_9ACTN|nr:hypothetical protein [Streptomyces puniciscabiei]TQK79281.1 hypothetical protein FB563_8276 [Streptomyces puniciscabiei]